LERVFFFVRNRKTKTNPSNMRSNLGIAEKSQTPCPKKKKEERKKQEKKIKQG
jgi:hypothetical protein